MRLDLIVSPVDEQVVTTTVAARHIRAEDIEEASDVARMVRTATALFEEETGRQILTATWRLFLRRFPTGREPVVLPKPPLRSVVQARYLDTAGVLNTWDAAEYGVVAPRGAFARPGVLFPKPGSSYPTSAWREDAVQIDFEAGWGAPDDVPEAVRDTVLALATGLYVDREPQIVGTTRQANRSFDRLLARHRLPVMA